MREGRRSVSIWEYVAHQTMLPLEKGRHKLIAGLLPV